MVDRLFELIQTGVRKEGRFAMSGLGTFVVGKRAARTGRNPAIGEKLEIKATNTAKFRAAPDLKAVAEKFKGEKRYWSGNYQNTEATCGCEPVG